MKKLICVALLIPTLAFSQTFQGFDDPTLDAVLGSPGEWGLRIVVLNVGQADAILVMAPNGDICLIDSGRTNAAGNMVADFLQSPTLNGIGQISTVDLLYSTHYDADHIGGLKRLVERGIAIRKAYDQGLSGKRTTVTTNGNQTVYGKYVAAVGDPNNNYQQDTSETGFVRHRADFGVVETMGKNDQIEIRIVAVRGDTAGTNDDIDLDPAPHSTFDENPGSIALLISHGEFEFYTAGDQTDDDWKSEPAVEESVINSGAISGGNDIDIIKVSHHGSDTSTSADFVKALDAEVAIVSTKFSTNHRLPKLVVLQQFVENRGYVLITGDGINPSDQNFARSSTTPVDDSFSADPTAIFNAQGNLTVLVSTDGSRYTVIGDSFARTFSANDADNQR